MQMFFDRAVLGVQFEPFMDVIRRETNISLGITSSVVAFELVHNVFLFRSFSSYCRFVQYDELRELFCFIINVKFLLQNRQKQELGVYLPVLSSSFLLPLRWSHTRNMHNQNSLPTS